MSIPNPLFTVASETVKAWPTFLPTIGAIRHLDPNGFEAFDVRLGYGLAVSWSLVVCLCVMGSDRKQGMKPIGLWLLSAIAMLTVYEIALRDESEVRKTDL